MLIFSIAMCQKVYAQSTTTSSGGSPFDGLPNNVRVICRTSGSIKNILQNDDPADGATFYKSIQNVIVLDRERKLFDVREHIAGDNSELDIFTKFPNISSQDLVNLLELRKLVGTKTAQVKMTLISNSTGKKYLFNDTDQDGQPVNSTIFIKIKRLTKKFDPNGVKNKKFIFADAFVKFILPATPNEILSDGSLKPIESTVPGTVSCQLRDCPVVDLKLEEDINDIFNLDPNNLFVEGRVMQLNQKFNEEQADLEIDNE